MSLLTKGRDQCKPMADVLFKQAVWGPRCEPISKQSPIPIKHEDLATEDYGIVLHEYLICDSSVLHV